MNHDSLYLLLSNLWKRKDLYIWKEKKTTIIISPLLYYWCQQWHELIWKLIKTREQFCHLYVHTIPNRLTQYLLSTYFPRKKWTLFSLFSTSECFSFRLQLQSSNPLVYLPFSMAKGFFFSVRTTTWSATFVAFQSSSSTSVATTKEKSWRHGESCRYQPWQATADILALFAAFRRYPWLSPK